MRAQIARRRLRPRVAHALRPKRRARRSRGDKRLDTTGGETSHRRLRFHLRSGSARWAIFQLRQHRARAHALALFGENPMDRRGHNRCDARLAHIVDHTRRVDDVDGLAARDRPDNDLRRAQQRHARKHERDEARPRQNAPAQCAEESKRSPLGRGVTGLRRRQNGVDRGTKFSQHVQVCLRLRLRGDLTAPTLRRLKDRARFFPCSAWTQGPNTSFNRRRFV